MDIEQALLPSTSIDGFTYEVRIARDCEFFRDGPMKENIPNLGEMMIYSNWFTSSDDCTADVTRLLISLAGLVRSITGKRYVIATKYNPLHDDNYVAQEEETWEPMMVMQIYVADAEILKLEHRVDTNIIATIKASPKVNLAQAQANLIPQ